MEQAVAFQGSRQLCLEYSLVLESKSIEHDVQERDGLWALTVAAASLPEARVELSRYDTERSTPRAVSISAQPFAGAATGVACYVFVLLVIAYCAGIGLFRVDWLAAGDLDASAPREWWRAVTPLTLHLDQEHLLGNLLFGAAAGLAVGRLLGPGVGWLSILVAAAIANYLEMLISPAGHRAVGASTAVFAALGMLSGLAWRQRFSMRARRWYRWAPLIAGICLLTFLGTGTARVDVLGHLLGFVCGVGFGWIFARTGFPSDQGRRLQIIAGLVAIALLGTAWCLALIHVAAPP